jgi:hypothetical protein
MAMATSPTKIPAVEIYYVPVGAVIAWYPPDQAELPPNFALCDGTVVDDEDSPFNGQPTPDLRLRFILGAVDEGGSAPVGSQFGDTGFNLFGYNNETLSTSPTEVNNADNAVNNIIQGNTPTTQWNYLLIEDDSENDGNHHHELPAGAIAVSAPGSMALFYIIRIK